MAVRFTSPSEAYTVALNQGSLVQLSVACWIKVSVDTNTYATPWVVDDGTTDYLSVKSGPTGTLMRVLTDAGVHGTQEFEVGAWYFVGVSVGIAGGRWVIRKHGSADWTGVTWGTGGSLVADNLRIGVWPDGSSGFDGAIAGFKVWDAELSEAALKAEYASMSPVRTANLLANYLFEGPSLVDNSGNGYTLTGGVGTTQEPNPDEVSPPATTGKIVEGFESATLELDFALNGWSRKTDSRHSGTYSLKCPTIGSSGSTETVLTLPEGALTLSFWYRVRSEGNADYFEVFLGGSSILKTSGDISWRQSATFDVSGQSTVRFRYSKDHSLDIGDEVWIDDIEIELPVTVIPFSGWGIPVF